MIKENTGQINFAIIGCGHIGKRHAEMIAKNSEARLAALCDVRPKGELGIEQYNVPFFESIESLLNSDIDIDVINICTPNGYHAPQALLALERKKHIVCEKPMTIRKTDAEQIILKAIENECQVFCVMQNRYSPIALWLKSVIDEGILGKIYFVQLNCFWNRDSRYYTGNNWRGTSDIDGGTLFTQFSHFIDMVYWLFGDIHDIKANFFDFNHQRMTKFEDSGVVVFGLENGGKGVMSYSTSVVDRNLESSLTIIAENGSIKVGGQYMERIDECYIKNYAMPDLPPVNHANDYGFYKGSAANHHYVIENVIDTLKGRARPTTTSFEGLKVVDVIERIYEQRTLKK